MTELVCFLVMVYLYYLFFIYDKTTLKIRHNAGFFSCCFVKLYEIIDFYKKNNKLPDEVDSSDLFDMYKYDTYKYDTKTDITLDFFEHSNNVSAVFGSRKKKIINWDEQFYNYKNVDYPAIIPFIKKYFTPSKKIKTIRNNLLVKYNIDVDNCVGLYYRGTDKFNETQLDSFDSYYSKLIEITNTDNNLKILVQTDSAPFLDYINNKNLNNVIVINENSTSYTNSGIHNEKKQYENYKDIQNLFATFLIISKCKYIICSSGNCSIWMMYYRENAKNVYQNLNKTWL